MWSGDQVENTGIKKSLLLTWNCFAQKNQRKTFYKLKIKSTILTSWVWVKT